MRACPACGSTNITIKLPQTSLWVCKDCGWEGTAIVEFPDEMLKKMKKNGECEDEDVEDTETFEEKIERLEKEMEGD